MADNCTRRRFFLFPRQLMLPQATEPVSVVSVTEDENPFALCATWDQFCSMKFEENKKLPGEKLAEEM